jgi:hypothetical protein
MAQNQNQNSRGNTPPAGQQSAQQRTSQPQQQAPVQQPTLMQQPQGPPPAQLPQQSRPQQVGQANSEPVFDEAVLASIVLNGDLSNLSPTQKVAYYRIFCQRLGLDPVSQPFKLLKLNGKEILYCDRTGAQQLNKIHEISHAISSREVVAGCFVVTARASTPKGRFTDSIGAVSVERAQGESMANAMMKAETKAKRRATLDLLGLGILDESEANAIPGAVMMDINGGNVQASAATPQGDRAAATAPQPQVKPQDVHPTQQKYQTPKQIADVLGRIDVDHVDGIKYIANLYFANAERIDADPELKGHFAMRKKAYYNSEQRQLAAQMGS